MAVARPQVSIRLGTTGRQDVERDFAAIGDAGDAQAKRYQASWERASAEVERAMEKQAKAAARLESVGMASTPLQQTINQSTGVSGIANDTGAARASAAAFAQQLDAADASAKRLLASVDPLYAAEMRYKVALEEVRTAEVAGALQGDQLVKVRTGLKAQYDDEVAMLGKVGEKSGTARLAQMEFMHVIRGSADALAAGAPPMQVFAMHLGMLSQSAQLAGGSMGKVGEFLGSGWGLALTVGVAVLGPMLAKLIDTGNAVDDLTDKLKKNARQERDNEVAHNIFAQSLDGVTDATRRNEDALKKLDDAHISAAQKALAQALAEIQLAKALEQSTKAQLDGARAILADQQAKVTAGGPGSEAATFAIQQQEALVNGLQQSLAQTDAQIAKNSADVLTAMSHLSVDAMEAVNDPVSRIKVHYQGLVDQARKHAELAAKAAHAAGDEAKAQQLVGTALKEQIAQLQIKEDADVKAAQARGRKAPANAGGAAIFNDQIASFFDIAARYRGMSETKDRGTLKSFLGNVDPEKTAWCAAFVNAVLAAGGVHGSGSLAAKSFLNFGKDDTHSPQRGDIVVVKSSASPSGSHVGFLDSIDAHGNVRVLGGNTGNKVGTLAASAKDVLAIRRPPTPSESEAADSKAADAAERARVKGLEQQGAFDSEAEKLRQQYLQALGKVVGGYDAQASVQQQRAQAEHDAEAQDIATNLAAGKYGDATSQLAQTRAQQLQAANDNALKERQAAIALDSYVKTLQDADAAGEQQAQFAADDLQHRESIARTARERRDLELQLIDLQFDEKKKHLEYLKALAELAGKTEEAARIQDQINNLPAEKGRAQDDANRNNMSPWDAYRDSLPHSWQDIGAAIETYGVRAVEDFTDGLATAIVQGKSLGDLLHSVFTQLLTDLIKLGEQEALGALFGKPGGGGGGGGGAGGLLGALGSLFGGGGSAIGSGTAASLGGTDFSSTLGSIGSWGGFATGTEYFKGGTAWVGEHGPELVRLPGGSRIHNAADSRRLSAANDGGIGAIHISIPIDATGADAAGLARVQAEVAQLRNSLPGLITQHWTNAADRFAFRGTRQR